MPCGSPTRRGFSYRGLHLDVARNFQSKDTVKKLLDLMAFYKLNRFHWHLTDDEGWRIEIKQLPELTEVGGRRGHTSNEANTSFRRTVPARSPDAAASSRQRLLHARRLRRNSAVTPTVRHISVIPELDFPGHARAAIKAMEARYRRMCANPIESAAGEFLLREPGDASKYESVQMWRDNVVDVGREATYRFLTVVVDELADSVSPRRRAADEHPSGGDEVPKGCGKNRRPANELPLDPDSKIPRRGQLELYFLNRVSEILLADRPSSRRAGKIACCWKSNRIRPLANARRAAGKPAPTAYVWNNVWGWGARRCSLPAGECRFRRRAVQCNAPVLRPGVRKGSAGAGLLLGRLC